MKQVQVFVSLEWILCILILTVVYLIALSGFGMALSCDSANYLSVASNIVQGNGFIQFDGFPYLNAAPLYPIILSPAYLFNLNPSYWAAILNYIFLISAVSIAGMQLQHFIRKKWLAMALPTVFFPYATFVSNSVWVLSEMLFVALFLAFIWNFHRAIHNQKGMRDAAILLSLMLLSRYATLMLIPGIGLVLYSTKNDKLLTKKASLLLLGFAPFLVWLGRNYVLSGLPLGQHNLQEKIQLFKLIQLPITTLLIALIAIILWIYSGIHLKGYPSKDERTKFLKVLFYLLSSYFFFLFLQGGIRVQQWPRMLSPMWLPLTLYFLIYLQLIWDEYANKKAVRNLLFISVLLLSLVQPALLLGKAVSMRKNGTGGYSTPSWKSLETAEINIHLTSEKPLSNLPDLIWLRTGKDAYHARFINEPEIDFLSRINEPKQLIWFKTNERSELLQSVSSYQLWLLNFNTESPHIISFGIHTAPVNSK